MQQPGEDVTLNDYCPYFDAATEVLGRRWAALVLRALVVGPARFGEISQRVPGVTDRMLARRLRELADSGFLEQVTESDGSARTSYRLTAKGASLAPLIVELNRWALEWVEPAHRG